MLVIPRHWHWSAAASCPDSECHFYHPWLGGAECPAGAFALRSGPGERPPLSGLARPRGATRKPGGERPRASQFYQKAGSESAGRDHPGGPGPAPARGGGIFRRRARDRELENPPRLELGCPSIGDFGPGPGVLTWSDRSCGAPFPVPGRIGNWGVSRFPIPDSRFRPNRESGIPSPFPGQIGNRRGERNWGFPVWFFHFAFSRRLPKGAQWAARSKASERV